MAYVPRCDDLNELHPYVKVLAEKLVAEAKAQGLNIKVIDTYRSVERQNYLYAQGRTEPGSIVTNANGSDKTSYHQWRLAFDCIQNVPGKEYDSNVLAKLGKIGQSIGLEWGGGWSGFKDAPHFQYTYGLSIAQLKAGAKIPTYNPINKDIVKVNITKSNVKVEDELLEVEVVNIKGNNYIKLRSLECKYLTIGFENNVPSVNVKKNGSCAAKTSIKANPKTYSVEVKKTAIRVCGEDVEADTVNIENFNYIKLRSLEGKAITIGFENGCPTVKLK